MYATATELLEVLVETFRKGKYVGNKEFILTIEPQFLPYYDP